MLECAAKKKALRDNLCVPMWQTLITYSTALLSSDPTFLSHLLVSTFLSYSGLLTPLLSYPPMPTLLSYVELLTLLLFCSPMPTLFSCFSMPVLLSPPLPALLSLLLLVSASGFMLDLSFTWLTLLALITFRQLKSSSPKRLFDLLGMEILGL